MKKTVWQGEEREKGQIGNPVGTPLSKNLSRLKAMSDIFGSCCWIDLLISYLVRGVGRAHPPFVCPGSLGTEGDLRTPRLVK